MEGRFHYSGERVKSASLIRLGIGQSMQQIMHEACEPAGHHGSKYQFASVGSHS